MFYKLSIIFVLLMIYSAHSAITQTSQCINDNNPLFKLSNKSLECDSCQWLVGKAEGYLLSNQTVGEIETEVDKLCKLVSFDSTCESLVHYLLPEVVTLLEEHLTPLVVCEKLNFCSTENHFNTRNKINNKEICNYIVFLTEKLLESNESKSFISNSLYTACELLPERYLRECEDFVSNDFTTFVKLLENNFKIENICITI